jgi:hypothetical protein
VPDYGTTGNSTISEDGTTMASSWSGPLSVGSNNATLTVNENNVVTLITADDGQTLHREGGGMTSPNAVNTTQNYTGGFPEVSGVCGDRISSCSAIAVRAAVPTRADACPITTCAAPGP